MRQRDKQTGATKRISQMEECGRNLQEAEAAGRFCDFSEKLAIVKPFGSHFARVWSHVKKLNG